MFIFKKQDHRILEVLRLNEIMKRDQDDFDVLEGLIKIQRMLALYF